MKYVGSQEREFPRYGVFKPGEAVDYDENLLKTGFFDEIKTKSSQKAGEK